MNCPSLFIRTLHQLGIWLEETGYDPLVKDLNDAFNKEMQAMVKSQEWGDTIPIGVFYENELETTFSNRLSQRMPSYLSNPPAKQKISDENGFSIVDLKQFFEDIKTNQD